MDSGALDECCEPAVILPRVEVTMTHPVRRWLFLSLLILVGVGLLAGCSSRPSQAVEKTIERTVVVTVPVVETRVVVETRDGAANRGGDRDPNADAGLCVAHQRAPRHADLSDRQRAVHALSAGRNR